MGRARYATGVSTLVWRTARTRSSPTRGSGGADHSDGRPTDRFTSPRLGTRPSRPAKERLRPTGDFVQVLFRPGEKGTVDRLNIDVYDDELRTEIQLVADLIVAANESTGPLPWSDIDALLRLRPLPDRTVNDSRSADGSKRAPVIPRQRAGSMRRHDA